ncbi:MAG: helix-turn-helix transcriptional regulator [Bacteroidetes bacterium]|nr:helix-turn-helix transcriptional regulator [Bacteroidota bacterium]
MSSTYSREEVAFLAKIGGRIKECRLKKALSQEKLALECDLDRTYVGSVERGERNISVLNLRKIAEALAVKPTSLLDFA